MGKTWVWAIVVVVMAIGAWEGFWRLRGFTPVIEDERKLWHLIRSKIDETTEVVFIGGQADQVLRDWRLPGRFIPGSHVGGDRDRRNRGNAHHFQYHQHLTYFGL